ncbi:hypothetical protein K439DRAFT_1558763 [Ramaria rubella]|nr:hypothetical protein K439DRAFT_1558763 [Ramaria rubella]
MIVLHRTIFTPATTLFLTLCSYLALMFAFELLLTKASNEAHNVDNNNNNLHNGRDNNNHVTEQGKGPSEPCNASVPSSPGGSNNDNEPSLPDDAPSIIQQLFYNFACNSEVHYQDLLIALGLGSLKGTHAQSNWNIFQRMCKDDINDICLSAPFNCTKKVSKKLAVKRPSVKGCKNGCK